MKDRVITPPNDHHTAFEDGDASLFVGTPTEIVIQMKHIEWGDTPPALEWKERVRMRASAFGFELEFFDALSFLHEMERHGLGRMRPDFVETLSSDSTKSNESATLDPTI
jgi:hypothetical protein